jgi:hypothetical protein
MPAGHDPRCPWPHVGDLDGGHFRTGRRQPRTLYLQVGAEPSDKDQAIGMLDTPGLAAFAVDAMNVCVERGHLAMGTWPCMVCGEERQDVRISVMRRPLPGDAGEVFRDGINVRYCNDRPACARYAAADGPWLGRPASAGGS